MIRRTFKLLLFITIFFFSYSAVEAAPANSSFKDDNFYKCVVVAYNNKHGTSLPYTTNLTDSQLESLTDLQCYHMNSSDTKITDVSGLQKLTGLTYLNLGYNQLTNIDLSKNTALNTL